jgi:hypothetical protein
MESDAGRSGDRWGARKQNMKKCQICGRASVPGAKLCSDCSSARKRAFAATVTQPLLEAAGRGRSSGRLLRPSQSVAATARRAAERSLYAIPPPAETAAVTSKRLNLILIAVGLAVALLIVAFIARQIQKGRQGADPPLVAEQPAAAVPAVVPSAVSLVPPGLSPKNVAETRMPDLTGAIPVDERLPLPSNKADAAKRAKQRNAPDVVPPLPESALAPPTVAAAPVMAPLPEIRETPKPDALQLMQEGLARCATGGVFDRIFCDQRVRREYCDGRWGQVPQCTSGVANDHGQ